MLQCVQCGATTEEAVTIQCYSRFGFDHKWEEPKNKYHLDAEIIKIYDEGLKIIQKKNQDYATQDDPFKNFRSAEVLGISVETAILVRTLDKMSRIGNCIKKDSTIVIEETVEDTILDAINYLALLLAYRRYNNNETKTLP